MLSFWESFLQNWLLLRNSQNKTKHQRSLRQNPELHTTANFWVARNEKCWVILSERQCVCATTFLSKDLINEEDEEYDEIKKMLEEEYSQIDASQNLFKVETNFDHFRENQLSGNCLLCGNCISKKTC